MTRSLVIHDLARSFGTHRVLDGLELEVRDGTLTAVLGPSGGGKTTLLRLVAGFDRPDRGSIRIGDRVVADATTWVAPERRRVGIVPQEGALFPHLTVEGNVGFGLDRREMNAAQRRRRVAEVLELVGLPGAESARPDQLSGGQQHRVALARALAPRPEVVLLDEPFSALDAGLRARLRGDVRDALQAQGTTAVLVTHDQTEALSMADEVAVLLDGHVAQVDTPERLYRHPNSLVVARFVGDAVVVPGHAGGGRVECALGAWDLAGLPDGEVTVLLRPEQFAIVDPTAGAGRVGVEGVVVRGEYYGHDSLLSVRLPGSHVITARTGAAAPPPPGTPVDVAVHGVPHVFPSAG